MAKPVGKKNMTTRAREEVQHELRKKIWGARDINELLSVEQTLAMYWSVLDSEQIAALRLRADLAHKRLAKVLPDAKAIDVTLNGDVNHNHTVSSEDVRKLSRSELQQLIADQLGSGGIETEGSGGKSSSVH